MKIEIELSALEILYLKSAVFDKTISIRKASTIDEKNKKFLKILSEIMLKIDESVTLRVSEVSRNEN